MLSKRILYKYKSQCQQWRDVEREPLSSARASRLESHTWKAGSIEALLRGATVQRFRGNRKKTEKIVENLQYQYVSIISIQIISMETR